MELRWRNRWTKEVGIAFVMDSDAVVLQAMGYEHNDDKDFVDEGENVEVWSPKKKEN